MATKASRSAARIMMAPAVVLLLGWMLVPLMMTLMFVFYHIPALDRYLADRYGAEFSAYAARTAKFVPGIY